MCVNIYSNTPKNRVIWNNKVTALKAWGKCALSNVIFHCKITPVMALNGESSFWRLKDVTNTCKQSNQCKISSVQWWKVGKSWRLQMCLHRLQCVRTCELLSNYSLFGGQCCMLLFWSSLQLTSKQLIISQQFTARANLFLNNMKAVYN